MSSPLALSNVLLTNPLPLFATALLGMFVAAWLRGRVGIPALSAFVLIAAAVALFDTRILTRDVRVILYGSIALNYIAFAAGLDAQLAALRESRGRGVLFGLLACAVPAAIAFLAAHFLLQVKWPAALVPGIVIAAHGLAALPILERLNLQSRPTFSAALGGSALSDSLGFILLAALVRVALNRTGPLQWIEFAACVGGFALLALLVLPPAIRWLIARMPTDSSGAAGAVALLLALPFLAAWGAEQLHVHPVLGAYFAGLAGARICGGHAALAARVRLVGETLFVPFALLSLALLFDFRALYSDIVVWVFLLLLFGATLVGKLAAAKALQSASGAKPREGSVVLGLSLPQSALAICTALIGFDQLRYFSETFATAVVLLILLTGLLGQEVVERQCRRRPRPAPRVNTP